jgi:hypothetical protein
MATGGLSKFMDRALNVLTVCAVAAFGVSLAGYLRPADTRNGGAQLGRAVDLSAHWNPGKKAVLIAVQPECPYCEQSTDFYKELVGAAGAAIDVIGVVPHSASAGREWFQTYGIKVTDVVKVEFTQLRVAATPTVIVLDDRHVVEGTWAGKLSSRTQDTVFAKLGVKRPAHALSALETKTLADLRVSAAAGDVIIDTRERADAKEASIAGALNIPYAEMFERMQHEVPQNRPVWLYCDYRPSCVTVFESPNGEGICHRVLMLARQLGYDQARTVGGSLEQIEAAGLTVRRAN